MKGKKGENGFNYEEEYFFVLELIISVSTEEFSFLRISKRIL